MIDSCPQCHNEVVGEFSPSSTRKWLTTLAKKGGMKAVLTYAGSVIPGFGNVAGFFAGAAVDVIYGNDINKLVDKVADMFEDNKLYVFTCPKCGKTWTRKEDSLSNHSSFKPKGGVYDSVVAIIANTLSVDTDDIGINSNLETDLGADSLDAVELIMEFEKKFRISIPDSDAEKMRTVGDIVSYLNDCLGLTDDNDDDLSDETGDGNFEEIVSYMNNILKQGQAETVSPSEKEYLEAVEVCFEEDGEITNASRHLLNKLRLKLGITDHRASILEQQVVSGHSLTDEEREYLDEYRECYAEGSSISNGERRLLNRLRDKLGISEDRCRELESMV